MYVLFREKGAGQWEPIGFYDSFPEAVCAMEEEEKKEDGYPMRVEKEDDTHDNPAGDPNASGTVQISPGDATYRKAAGLGIVPGLV